MCIASDRRLEHRELKPPRPHLLTHRESRFPRVHRGCMYAVLSGTAMVVIGGTGAGVEGLAESRSSVISAVGVVVLLVGLGWVELS
ncbi:hypothetical protein EX30DRAFT_225939 [Ascodesmis nigricans]|uniref:Uncharacterized protein n=1 Tax=Ascodesmis nigricans TaxID=341454 RepID=A0A4S2MJC0_9PEZI|nr:hypothetical protein EX30DRAFT_225939 [Ascodesmis nigricans]